MKTFIGIFLCITFSTGVKSLRCYTSSRGKTETCQPPSQAEIARHPIYPVQCVTATTPSGTTSKSCGIFNSDGCIVTEAGSICHCGGEVRPCATFSKGGCISNSKGKVCYCGEDLCNGEGGSSESDDDGNGTMKSRLSIALGFILLLFTTMLVS